jgi:hypothetical protein
MVSDCDSLFAVIKKYLHCPYLYLTLSGIFKQFEIQVSTWLRLPQSQQL